MDRDDSIDIETRIIDTLAGVADAGHKATLLIMLQGFKQLRDEIRKLREDAEHTLQHQWIARKMTQELEDRRSQRRIRDGVMEKVAISALSVIGTLLVIGLVFAREGLLAWRFWGP